MNSAEAGAKHSAIEDALVDAGLCERVAPLLPLDIPGGLLLVQVLDEGKFGVHFQPDDNATIDLSSVDLVTAVAVIRKTIEFANKIGNPKHDDE